MEETQSVSTNMLGKSNADCAAWQNESVVAMEARRRAHEAMKARIWPLMAIALRECLELEPDWLKGHFNLRQALLNSGDNVAARSALWAGLRIAPELRSLSTMLINLHDLACAENDFTEIACEVQGCAESMAQKQPGGCWDPCVALEVATQDAMGSAQTLYRSAVTGNVIFDASQPLRLIFLDVDGVLNTADSANSGAISNELLSRLRNVILHTGAFVILSSTWRNWAQLRVLIMAALPYGSVIGQTPLEDAQVWRNEVRPREIRDFLAHIKTEGGHVAAWAAVDDMDLARQANDLARTDKGMRCFAREFDNHFVRTSNIVGFDEADAARLVQLLA